MSEPISAGKAEPITARVAEFCRMSGLCRTKVYELIREGELESVRIGKLRLVVIDSYRRLLSRQATGKVRPYLLRMGTGHG